MLNIGRIFCFVSFMTTFGFVPNCSAAAMLLHPLQPPPNSRLPTLSQNGNYVMTEDSNGNQFPLGNSSSLSKQTVWDQFDGEKDEPKLVFQCFKGTICNILFPMFNESATSNPTVLTYISRHPSWMLLKSNMTFIGFPPHKGLSQYILRYTSLNGENREVPFQIQVDEYPAPNHIIDIVMKTPSIEQLRGNPKTLYWLMKDLSAALHSNISSLTMQHARGVGNFTQISVFNNTLSVKDCDQNGIANMWNYIFSSNNEKIRKHFIRTFGLYHQILDISLERTGNCAKAHTTADTSTSSHSGTSTKSPAEVVAIVTSWKNLARTLIAVAIAIGLTVVIVVATMGWKKRIVEEQENEGVELGIMNPLHEIEQTDNAPIEPIDSRTDTTILSGADDLAE